MPSTKSKKLLYLVDEPLLDNMDWLVALKDFAGQLIVMSTLTRDSSTCPLQAADFISKPLVSCTLYQILLQQLGIALPAKQQMSSAIFANAFAFNANILLVEDSKMNQEVASGMLAMFGCSVEIAQNGAEAVDKVKSHQYDLILMDCQMPVMDGYTATHQIRHWEQQENRVASKIVALTAGMGMNYQQDCLNSGMDKCLLKPFTGQQLLDILNSYLGHALIEKESENVAINEQALSPERSHISVDGAQNCLDMERIDEIRQIEKQSGHPILSRIIDIFEQEMQHHISDINDAYSNQDSARVAEIAHAMKSLAGNVGAEKLRTHCQMIELAGVGEILSSCLDNMKALKPAYLESMKHLASL